MTEAVIGDLEIGSQIYGLAKQLPQDISTWKLHRDLLPARLKVLGETLSLVSEQLQLFSNAVSSTEDVTANQFQHAQISLNIKHCKLNVKKISEIILRLDRHLKKRRIAPLPLKHIAKTLDAVEPEYRELR